MVSLGETTLRLRPGRCLVRIVSKQQATLQSLAQARQDSNPDYSHLSYGVFMSGSQSRADTGT